jgi:hypothetical protein
VHAAERVWPLDDIALDEVNAELAQGVERFLVLDLLGDHQEIEAF